MDKHRSSNAKSPHLLAPPSQVRDDIIQRCADILFVYRQHCASNSSPAQLILPEALKLFPLYTLAVLKTDAFLPNPADAARARTAIAVRADARAYALHALIGMPVDLSVRIFYPAVMPLHDMPLGCGYPAKKDTGTAGGTGACSGGGRGRGGAAGSSGGQASPAKAAMTAFYGTDGTVNEVKDASQAAGEGKEGTEGTGAEKEEEVVDDFEEVVLPPFKWPSAESIDEGGMCLFHDGREIFLYV